MAIPLLDLKAQYRSIKTEIDAAVGRVLESAQFVLGDDVAAFERDFAAYCGAAHAIGVNSGTSALHLALIAAGVTPGDEVITVPFTFVATASAIEAAGARPVFVDIDERRCTMDVAGLAAAVTGRTKAIIPVHLYGQPADMDGILAVADRYGIPVIEDAAQAHGAQYRGRRAGSMGLLSCFSFYPTKNLGAVGDAGAVVTQNAQLAERVRVMRDWGQLKKYEHAGPGFNYRMASLQGAVLAVKLRYLEKWTERRRSRATLYDSLLSGSAVGVPYAASEVRHVYHTYTIRTARRAAVAASLRNEGIQFGIHYPIPVHLQPSFAHLGYERGDFPVSERAAEEVLSLPMYPELSDDDVSAVVAAVNRA